MNIRYENIKNKYLLYQVKKHHLIIMVRLHALLSHGFTLIEALTFLFEQLNIKNKNYKTHFYNLLNQGSTCFELFKYLGFPNTVLMQIYFAEQYGALPNTLKKCHTYYSQNVKLTAQFYKSIQYPIILLLIFLFLIMILNHTVMPEFRGMYSTMDLEESTLQIILSVFIAYFPILFILLLTLTILSFFIFKLWLQKQTMPRQILLLSNIPIFSKYYRLFITYQVANQFALFFKNGISLNDIVHIYTHQEESRFLQYLGVTLRNSIHKGMNFAEVMCQFQCFERHFISYIVQGEKRDKLDIELIVYAQFLLDHIEQFIKKHISYIQPIMFALIGLLILSVYLVMMLPIFEMMQTIQN